VFEVFEARSMLPKGKRIMKFKGNSMRTAAKLLSFVQKHPQIHLVFNTVDSDPSIWTRLGFNEQLEAGQCIVPACIGSATTFNARGKELINKELPKERRYFMSYRTWQDWHGREHSGTQFRGMDCYQRAYIAAPSELLYVIQSGTEVHIASRALNAVSENEQVVLHICNLMLECFGEFEVLDASSKEKIGPKLKRLQWEILPPGEYPWAKAKPFIRRVTERFDKPSQDVIEFRMARIAQYKPDGLHIGRGGFDGYFVYSFEKKKLFVLESAHLDNATYIFKEGWQQFSQLTKNEIINGKVPHRRLIHDHKWHANLNSALNS
jgi:hypothetical protein